MTITTKEAAGIIAGGHHAMPNPNLPKSIVVSMRPAGGGSPKRIELMNGMQFKAVRGFGIKGTSIAIGTILTIGKEIDFELAAFLVNSSKVVLHNVVGDETPFERLNEPKGRK